MIVKSGEVAWYDGRMHDLAELVPNGVTQWGTAAPAPVPNPPAGYATALPFAASAIAAGR